MQMQWSLRSGTQEDLPDLAKIEKESHAFPWKLEHFQKELEKPYSQLLILTDDETDSKIAGYIVFWMMFDECEILNIVVDHPYRGKGLGKNMVRQAIKQASQKGMKRTVLDVRKSNLNAVLLYQSCHFLISHIRKNAYPDGEDAYHMTLSLEGEEVPSELI